MISAEDRDRLGGKTVIASVSGGKDSAYLSLLLHEAGIADAYGGDEAEENNARTGCVGCPLVQEDRALNTVLRSPRWAYLAPLSRLKALYRELRKPQHRLRKTGGESRADGSLPLLLALPPPEEVDELRERLREADSPDPVLLPDPPEPPLLRRPEERLPAPLPIIALQAPPAPPERYCCYSHLISPHRGKRRRRWPEEPAGGANKNQRQRRRDARRNGRP